MAGNLKSPRCAEYRWQTCQDAQSPSVITELSLVTNRGKHRIALQTAPAPCCQSGKRSPGSSAVADDHTCHLTGVCWNLWKAFPAKPPAAEKNGGCLESWHLLQHCRHICLVECDLKNDMSNRDLNKLICSRSSLDLCLRIDEKRTNNINNEAFVRSDRAYFRT